MSPSHNIQETFFYLKTLSLRRESETPANYNGSRENIVTTSTQRDGSTVSSIELDKSKQCSCLSIARGLTRSWKPLLFSLALLANIISLAVISKTNSDQIQQNLAYIQNIKTLLPTTQPLHTVISTAPPQTAPSAVQSTEDPSSDNEAGGIMKNILLSLASVQAEVRRLKSTASANAAAVSVLQNRVKGNEKEFKSWTQLLLKESNLTLCSDNRYNVTSPVDGIVRLTFSARVQGSMYASKKLFELHKNGKVLKNGGTVRARGTEAERKVKCVPSDPRPQMDCVVAGEVVLVATRTGDTLSLVDRVSEAGVGRVEDIQLCLQLTAFNSLPGGMDSLLVTH